MIELEQVGARICELRKSADLTQAGLAENLNVSHQAVSKWETGLSLPDAEYLVRLAKLFNTSIEHLLTGEPQAEATDSGEKAPKIKLDMDRIASLAPIIDRDTLDTLITLSEISQAQMYHLHSLAPFVSCKTLESVIHSMSPEDICFDELRGIEAFLSDGFIDGLMSKK